MKKQKNTRNETNTNRVKQSKHKHNNNTMSQMIKHNKCKGGANFAVRDKHGNAEMLTIQRLACRVVFSCAVDVSGSMSGGRTETAIAGLRTIVQSAMRKSDLYGLVTFDGSVKKLHFPMPVSKVDFEKDVKHIRANGGGCTALFDAMDTSLRYLKNHHSHNKKNKNKTRCVFQHLVITDGQNNSGTLSLEEMKEILKKPGLPDYHFTLIAVGISEGAAKEMRELCKPKHCHFWHAKNLTEFSSCMERAAKRIKITLQKRCGETGLKTKTEWVGKQKHAKNALIGMANSAPQLMRELEKKKNKSLADSMKRLLL